MTEAVIWRYFRGKGLADCGTAGLMGDLYAESGLRPNNLQNTFEKKLGLSDAEYTARVDSGAYANFVRDGAGYGLAQWTYWSRKESLLNYAQAAGKSIGDLEMQLDFLWEELNKGYRGLVNTLASAKSVRAASDAVLTQFERPADRHRLRRNREIKPRRKLRRPHCAQRVASERLLIHVSDDALSDILPPAEIIEDFPRQHILHHRVHRPSPFACPENCSDWNSFAQSL